MNKFDTIYEETVNKNKKEYNFYQKKSSKAKPTEITKKGTKKMYAFDDFKGAERTVDVYEVNIDGNKQSPVYIFTNKGTGKTTVHMGSQWSTYKDIDAFESIKKFIMMNYDYTEK